jgi:hypothetical protein
VTTPIRPGRLVWVPDDGERGIVIALSEDKKDVLVCFAAWKNGASEAVISEENAMLFVPPHGSMLPEAKKVGWASPYLLPKGTFIEWYPIDDCVFDTPEPWDDRAGWCREAFPEDDRLLR